MMTAIGPAMVTAYIPMKLKGKTMGTVFTMQAFGAAIGPTIGGILTQYLSWNWIFFINIPIGIAAILLGKKVIPEMAVKNGGPGSIGPEQSSSLLDLHHCSLPCRKDRIWGGPVL